MKNIFQKIGALSLCGLMIFGVSCTEEPQTETPENSVRWFNATPTGEFLIENGRSDYQIVIPESATDIEAEAGKELQSFIKEGTGVVLPVIEDTGLDYSETAKYISLGATTVFAGSGASYEADILGEEGFVIQTKGKCVLCTGAAEYGTLWAAYELLSQTLNFEQYYLDAYALDKNVKNVPLMDYDIQDVPDIEYRSIEYFCINNAKEEQRMRFRPKDDEFVLAFSNRVSNHCAFKYLEPTVYNDPSLTETYHPEWYSVDNTQLCYLARGDEESFALMIKTVGDKMIEHLAANPDRIYLQFGHEDNLNWCTCDDCKEWNETYKANAAVAVNFCNYLREYIDGYYEENDIEREYYITFFAYYGTNPAPAQYNDQTGEYEPINGLRCKEGVYVFWADTFVNYQESIYGPTNAAYYQSLLGWRAISDEMLVWTYDTNFYYMLQPFDSFNTMVDFYRLMENLGVKYIFDQGQGQYGGSTGWSSLKIYLTAKLCWDVNADVEQLTKDFFENVYGLVSDTMLGVYNDFRLHCSVMEATQGFGGNNAVYQSPNAKFWPEHTLIDWANRIDGALEKIKVLQDDQKEYERLYKQIVLERIAYNYLRIELYASQITASELLELKMQTKTDIELIGMTFEGTRPGSVSNLFAKWGV